MKGITALLANDNKVVRKESNEILDVGAPITEEKGQVIGASTFARDTTERKQAAKALSESEERYRTLFDLCPVAVYCKRVFNEWVAGLGGIHSWARQSVLD